MQNEVLYMTPRVLAKLGLTGQDPRCHQILLEHSGSAPANNQYKFITAALYPDIITIVKSARPDFSCINRCSSVSLPLLLTIGGYDRATALDGVEEQWHARPTVSLIVNDKPIGDSFLNDNGDYLNGIHDCVCRRHRCRLL